MIGDASLQSQQTHGDYGILNTDVRVVTCKQVGSYRQYGTHPISSTDETQAVGLAPLRCAMFVRRCIVYRCDGFAEPRRRL